MNRRPRKRKRGKREAAFEKVGGPEGAAGRSSCVPPRAHDSVSATRIAFGEFVLSSKKALPVWETDTQWRPP